MKITDQGVVYSFKPIRTNTRETLNGGKPQRPYYTVANMPFKGTPTVTRKESGSLVAPSF